MGLLDVFRRSEKRAVIPLSGAVNVADVDGMRQVFGYDLLTDAQGQAVAERCRSIISQSTASVPLAIYRRTDGGRQEAREHPLWPLLNDESSEGVSAFRFRENLARDVARYGNGIARIGRNGRGDVEELEWLPWRQILLEIMPSGRWRYRYTDNIGRQRIHLASEILHVRYSIGSDGFTGVDPLTLAKTSTALVAAQAELALAQVRRGFTPDLSFETASTFADDTIGATAFQRLKDQLTERLNRMGRNPTALLLEGGLSAKPLAAPGREQQFHESRVLGLEDLARAYGVPLSVVGLGKQSSYSSLNEESRSLVKYCVAPWSKLLEDEMRVALLTREERATLSLEHDLSGLMRGSTVEEFKALQTAVGGPFLAPDEAREWLGYNPTKGGGTVRFPLNMAAANATEGSGDA